MTDLLGADALDQLFLKARTQNDWKEEALDEAYNNGASGVSFFDGPDEEYLHKFKAYLDKRGFVVK